MGRDTTWDETPQGERHHRETPQGRDTTGRRHHKGEAPQAPQAPQAPTGDTTEPRLFLSSVVSGLWSLGWETPQTPQAPQAP